MNRAVRSWNWAFCAFGVVAIATAATIDLESPRRLSPVATAGHGSHTVTLVHNPVTAGVTQLGPLVANVAPVAPRPEPERVCPEGMVHVAGSYCTEVRHTCKKWLDDPSLPFARCQTYEPKARCVGERVTLDYCIDRTEHVAAGDDKPLHNQSFIKGAQVCKQQGKRLCHEREWNFACEGPEMLPYPYGWERKPVCNQDLPEEVLFDQIPGKTVLRDNRMAAGANPECKSPFGVLDLAGNLDEPVIRLPLNYPFRNALKGGWWMAARNRCRPATTAHDDHYQDVQVGVRCCADTPGAADGAKG